MSAILFFLEYKIIKGKKEKEKEKKFKMTVKGQDQRLAKVYI